MTLLKDYLGEYTGLICHKSPNEIRLEKYKVENGVVIAKMIIGIESTETLQDLCDEFKLKWMGE